MEKDKQEEKKFKCLNTKQELQLLYGSGLCNPNLSQEKAFAYSPLFA